MMWWPKKGKVGQEKGGNAAATGMRKTAKKKKRSQARATARRRGDIESDGKGAEKAAARRHKKRWQNGGKGVEKAAEEKTEKQRRSSRETAEKQQRNSRETAEKQQRDRQETAKNGAAGGGNAAAMTQGRTGRKPTEKGRAESRRKRNGMPSDTARQAVVKNDALRPGRREMSDRFPQEKPFPLFSFAFVSCIMIHEKVCAAPENARRQGQRDKMNTRRPTAETKR